MASRDFIKKWFPWIAFVPLLGGSWAMSLVAAHLIIDPHVARATERVKIMCLWAKMQDDYSRTQNENTVEICKAVGVKCKAMPDRPANPLLDGCEERRE